MASNCSRHDHRRAVLLWVVGMAIVSGPAIAAAGSPASPGVTLLVHGIKVDLNAPIAVWGRPVNNGGGTTWDGLIGHLQQSGHRFGGIIRAPGTTIRLPACLDRSHTSVDPSQATLFALEFSAAANVDGLAYKALELAECLSQLRQMTGCAKIRIVAHSAGGLVARAYLQGAVPKLPYAGDVERLITVATPHLGSDLAEHLGDFLGTRATAIQPGGELIRRLNSDLDLPRDVLFASVIVRGVGTSVAAIDFSSKAYDRYIDRERLQRLPIDFRRGSDQVVDVRSQNLRLTPAAARYEAASGRPVLYLLARVADPTPADRSFAERSVHEAATSDPWVALWVEMLLQNHERFWAPLEAPLRERWIELQASLFAYGALESHAAARRPLSQVIDTKLMHLAILGEEGSNVRIAFQGESLSRIKLLGRTHRGGRLAGIMNLSFDRFGRITAEDHIIQPSRSE